MTTRYLSSIYTYQATVTGYDAANNIVSLSSPVNLSVGYNGIAGLITSHYSMQGTATSVASAINNGTNLAGLSTDEGGNFIAIFNVPSSTFQAGQRVFRVDNRSVASQPGTATTYSEATFTATSLSLNAQNQDFSPSVDSATHVFTQVSDQSSSQVVTSTISTVSPYDPLAQTFLLPIDNFPNGAFLSSVKLFFAAVPSTNMPIKLSIVNTLNGYPNGQVLDYSTVVLNTNQVVTSTTPHYLDPTTYTEFVFDAPVYVQSGVLYGILLHSSSPDYQVYYAQQNQIAIPSSAKALPSSPIPPNPTKIGTAPYIGSLFESQNSITWTGDQTKDLMFVIDRCVFNIGVQPQIQFTVPQNLPARKVGINDILYSLDANSVTNLFGNYSTANNMAIDALNVTTTDFVPTDTGNFLPICINTTCWICANSSHTNNSRKIWSTNTKQRNVE